MSDSFFKSWAFPLFAALLVTTDRVQASPTVVRELNLIGMNATAFAAGGVTRQQALQAITGLKDSVELQGILTARTALAQANSALAAALKASDAKSNEGMIRVRQAQQVRDAASDAVESARQQLHAKVDSLMPPEVVPRLIAWRTSAPTLPPSFRTVQWTQPEIVLIQNALLQETAMNEEGVPMTPEALATLADVRGRAEVVAAASRVESEREAIQGVFEQAAATTAPQP
jgi:hypothetical protein